MPVTAHVVSIRPLESGPYASPESDSLDVQLDLEDGTNRIVVVETPDQIARVMDNDELDHLTGEPAVFVRRADQAAVEAAMRALAADPVRLEVYGAKRRAGSPPHGVVSCALKLDEPGCGRILVALADGRRFELPACEPAWFEREFARLGLDRYFGPPAVFVRALDEAGARAAVADMTLYDDSWLRLYDCPGGRLPALMKERL